MNHCVPQLNVMRQVQSAIFCQVQIEQASEETTHCRPHRAECVASDEPCPSPSITSFRSPEDATTASPHTQVGMLCFSHCSDNRSLGDFRFRYPARLLSLHCVIWRLAQLTLNSAHSVRLARPVSLLSHNDGENGRLQEVGAQGLNTSSVLPPTQSCHLGQEMASPSLSLLIAPRAGTVALTPLHGHNQERRSGSQRPVGKEDARAQGKETKPAHTHL